MLRHKAALLHAAHEHPCPQHMKSRLWKSYRQQHTAAVHHGRALRQRGEILPGKLLPCGKTLRRGGLPCPGIPGAAARALHGVPAGATVCAAGAAGICGLGRLRLALALFARLGSGGKPELLLRGVFSLRRPGRARCGAPCSHPAADRRCGSLRLRCQRCNPRCPAHLPVQTPGGAAKTPPPVPRPPPAQRCRWSTPAARREPVLLRRSPVSVRPALRTALPVPRSAAAALPAPCGTFPRRSKARPPAPGRKTPAAPRQCGRGSR